MGMHALQIKLEVPGAFFTVGRADSGCTNATFPAHLLQNHASSLGVASGREQTLGRTPTPTVVVMVES